MSLFSKRQQGPISTVGILVRRSAILLFPLFLAMAGALAQEYEGLDPILEREPWLRAITAAPLGEAPEKPEAAKRRWHKLVDRFPIHMDWLQQDMPDAAANHSLPTDSDSIQAMTAKILAELGNPERLGKALADLEGRNSFSRRRRCLRLYSRACQERRVQRLTPLQERWPRIVFTKHFNLGASHYAYTENLSDAAYPERKRTNADYRMGASLCLLQVTEQGACQTSTLLEDSGGVIRDPDVSFDGERILFAWRKSPDKDDYHLYEMNAATREVRQLTQGLGHADYEGIYLPSGDILFNSSRCVQIVDCWWTDVSNLYRCDKDGGLIRRVTFDQVHTNYPTLLGDGRIIYTRWDYNDRGQIYPQPLFQMNSDGTAQREFYGNNSWFPTTVLHARGVPDSPKVMAVLSGHHSHQRGKLALLDVRRGTQEAVGAQLIAPVRETPPDRVDAYGQGGDQFQYPYPLSESEFLVTYTPYGAGNREYVRPYGLYFMNADGRRELLASDPAISCNQPVPLAAREKPHLRSSQVDYAKKTGVYYVQDVYAGPGLKGVPRGTVKRLRVVALEYRPAGIRSNRNEGPAGGALASTPVAIGNGCWDVKVVLGDADVYADGSACFEVPARTPVYFQALDGKGHAVQTMRTWSTLQPGEQLSCVGCHEYKSNSPARRASVTQAMHAGAQKLAPFYGPPRGFSFPRDVQPILDRHCVRCHDERAGEERDTVEQRHAFSLLAETQVEEKSGRRWSDSYLALTDVYLDQNGYMKGKPGKRVSWISVQSAPPLLPPYHAGAAQSPVIALLEDGHNGVELTRKEMDIVACWIDLLVPYCGDYTEANAWTPREHAKYAHCLDKRASMEALDQQSIAAILAGKP